MQFKKTGTDWHCLTCNSHKYDDQVRPHLSHSLKEFFNSRHKTEEITKNTCPVCHEDITKIAQEPSVS